eukprot:TRINITY_DN1126_c0_g1_i1.p5 TRINITY_DN1126_c0_g1~~TRINITY_DN1126_c0_g1_i1.p5  ORF type:complete len:193 (-),score=12.14 TRINITY_DN1126_c0_g1_i1:1245-1823(-)
MQFCGKLGQPNTSKLVGRSLRVPIVPQYNKRSSAIRGVRLVVNAQKMKSKVDQSPKILDGTPFTVHGRHMEVSPEMSNLTKTQLQQALADYDGALFVEGDTARIVGVDIRLWKQKAEIRLQMSTNVNNISTLRKGEIYVEDNGVDSLDSVRNACIKLTKKLHKMNKPQFRDRSSRNYWQKRGMGEQGARRRQ